MITTSTTYAIRVDGHLDDHWSERLAGLTIARNGDGTSTLTGPVADQAQLHGVLAGLRDIAATVLDLRAAPAHRPVLEYPLHTSRLTLRSARAEDADSTWRYRQLESVTEWLTGQPAGIDSHRERFTDPARLATTLVVHLGPTSSSEVIGDLTLRREDAWAQLEVADEARAVQAELGWVFDPAHTRRGYATEAVRELLRHCFEDLGLRRVTAACFLDNEASWRVMERVGMRRELYAVRDALHRSGRWVDSVSYAVLVEEWDQARA